MAVMAGNRAALYRANRVAGWNCLCLGGGRLIDCAAAAMTVTAMVVGRGGYYKQRECQDPRQTNRKQAFDVSHCKQPPKINRYEEIETIL